MGINLYNEYSMYNIIILSFIIYFLRQYFRGCKANRKSMKNKLIIITGCSSGIGKATALQLLEDGATVIFACRNKEKTMNIINKETKHLINSKECKDKAYFIHLDLSSFKSVNDFVKEFKNKFYDKNIHLDILINNAGLATTIYKETEDGLEYMSQTNHFSHVLLTLKLLDYFNKNEGKIINVSSYAYNFSNYKKTLKSCFSKEAGHNQYKDLFGAKNSFVLYGNTKLANIYFTNFLTKMFEKSNKYNHLHSYSLHPGSVYTNFTNNMFSQNILMKFIGNIIIIFAWYFLKNESDGAQTQLDLCCKDIRDLKDGGFYMDKRLTKLNNIAKDEDLENYLMDETLKIINMKI